jgi:UTP--glucose-1-phosphate uridylyltransferase
MEEQPVFGYAFEGRRYDAGTTMGWLQASVELALARPDTGSEFREYLRSLDI